MLNSAVSDPAWLTHYCGLLCFSSFASSCAPACAPSDCYGTFSQGPRAASESATPLTDHYKQFLAQHAQRKRAAFGDSHRSARSAQGPAGELERRSLPTDERFDDIEEAAASSYASRGNRDDSDGSDADESARSLSLSRGEEKTSGKELSTPTSHHWTPSLARLAFSGRDASELTCLGLCNRMEAICVRRRWASAIFCHWCVRNFRDRCAFGGIYDYHARCSS